MGYDLYWVNDPYEAERDALFQTITDALPANADADTLLRSAAVVYRALEEVGGYFRTSNAVMRSLVAEMDAQELFADAETMRETLLRQSGTIPPEEIQRVLDRLEWPLAPTDAQPPVVVGELDQAFATAELANRTLSSAAEPRR